VAEHPRGAGGRADQVQPPKGPAHGPRPRPRGHRKQNFLDFNPNLEPHWQTFDLRSIAWPDPAVVGFVDAPPLG
jgi:hypothetical protein